MERAFHLGPHGRWWNNPELVQKLGLTADQQKKMEAIFQQNRPSLMDLSSSLRKEETSMEPLLAADQPDEGKILAQIDRVAQARAELEKANARMLLGLRRVLTPDQWKTLQAEEPHMHRPHFNQGPRNESGPPPPQ
jgi:Spy/CpxP family protein refolding chaperone